MAICDNVLINCILLVIFSKFHQSETNFSLVFQPGITTLEENMFRHYISVCRRLRRILEAPLLPSGEETRFTDAFLGQWVLFLPFMEEGSGFMRRFQL